MTAHSRMDDDKPLLGVTGSLLGRAWHDRCAGSIAQANAAKMVQAQGLPDLVARILAGRGVPPDQAESHLKPRLRDLMPDPCILRDMDAATDRLAHAVASGEQVAIFGDYDVDGAASAALLSEYLEKLGARVRIHIPDRLTEGYGPNIDAIEALATAGATLLVCVDCGTAGHGPFEAAAARGVDVVVLDHHGAPEALPPIRALVNPNRGDDISGLGHLCAAGVVFLTLVALNRALRRRGFFAARAEPDLLRALDLVALATVADVVPLVGINRAFVVQGLAVTRGRERPGLAALLDAAGLSEPPQAWHLGFLVGPRINAGGRIGDSGLGARLLTTTDPIAARAIAAELDRLNRERQRIEAEAVADAVAEMERDLARLPDQPVLVVGAPNWHPGIVGLIAARLKERFGRPAFAFAIKPDGTAVGSGRSVLGVDLGEAVREAEAAGIVLKGGGHAMAAGATIAATELDAFRDRLTDRLGDAVATAGANAPLLVDGTLTAGAATADLIDRVHSAGPFGQGSPEPVFAFPGHRLVDSAPVGNGHVRARWQAQDGRSIAGIAFRVADSTLGLTLLRGRGQRFHVAGSLSAYRRNGNVTPQVKIEDLSLLD